MSNREQIIAFESELRTLVNRFRKEFELDYASAIGVLQMKIMELFKETEEDDESD